MIHITMACRNTKHKGATPEGKYFKGSRWYGMTEVDRLVVLRRRGENVVVTEKRNSDDIRCRLVPAVFIVRLSAATACVET